MKEIWMGRKDLRFRCFYHFNNWYYFSLGLHIDITCPNIEIHLPFGFIKLGWTSWDYPEARFCITWWSKEGDSYRHGCWPKNLKKRDGAWEWTGYGVQNKVRREVK